VRADIDSYVEFRMRAAGYRGPNVFEPQAMRLIARASEGLTRRINILSDKALLATFADGTHQVTAKHARQAIQDSEFAGRRRLSERWWLLGAGIAAGLVFGGALHFYISQARGNGAHGAVAPAAAEPARSSPANTSLAAASGGVVSASVASAPGQGTAIGPPGGDAAAQQPAGATATPTVAPAAPPEARQAAVRAAETSAGPTPPASGKLAQERFAATQQWLKTAPAGQFTIQLLTVSAADTATLERFLRQSADLVDVEQIRVYSVKINGEQHYSATYGLYPSLEATIDGMGALPSAFKARGPYHRSVSLMRRQNQE
jgi:septal ring-binding cell division protein DamX